MVSNSISIQELDKSDIPSKVEEKLIKLLSEFVDMIASHANIELGRTPKVFWNPQYEKYLRLIKVVPHSHPAAVRKSPESSADHCWNSARGHYEFPWTQAQVS